MTMTQALPYFSIGSFQAKTYFAELLRRVIAGAVVTITRNGQAVAVMQSPARKKQTNAQKAWKNMLALSQQISAQNSNNPVTIADITAWKNDGRR